MSTSAQPLHGVKVIEFCHVAAGPFCGMLLSDFGAEVTKIESPEGDAMRQWPPLSQGFSENFASLNRGKQSVVLDLKQPAQRDLARDLVQQADVLVENNRPGAMSRLGLGWDWFGPRQPGLIYCSISAIIKLVGFVTKREGQCIHHPWRLIPPGIGPTGILIFR
jgi:crotonobetainyl-CoA:carnitine CoA-transferase CaiB-like acyl-CoA transferase